MGSSGQEIRAGIADEAADWFVRNRDPAQSAAERSDFAAWLTSSPLHVEAYLRTAVLSRDLHVALDGLDTDVDALLRAAASQEEARVVPIGRFRVPAPIEPTRYLGTRWRVAGVAAVAVMILLGAAWTQRDGERFGLPRILETARGEERSSLLPDGTAVTLDSDSAVRVRYSREERVVQLLRGQALFKVAHEPLRRFRVAVGEAEVIAVGTVFDVKRVQSSTEVTVVEGKVAVFTGAMPPGPLTPLLPTGALALTAGEQLKIHGHLPPPAPLAVNVHAAVAWVQRQIVFDQRPLGEVADEFNRYGPVPIVVEGPGLRALPISGVISTNDADSFVAFLGRLDGVKVYRGTDRIVVDSP